MKSLRDMGLSVNQLIIALLLVIMGVLTYYVAPTAFFFKRYGIFFGILNAVLLQMIIGLTFLSILILPAFQKLFLGLFLCCCKRDKKLKQIILKNLQSHEKRNTKTAIMFAISLSFLIFAGSTFALLGTLVVS